MRGLLLKSGAFLAAALVTGAPAQAKWQEAASRHFIVYSEGSEERLRKVVSDLEKYHFMLRLVSGTKAPPGRTRMRIYLMQDTGEVADSLPYDVAGVAGFYTTSPRGPIAVSTRMATGGEFGLGAQQVLFHELAHHFMNQYFPAAYPTWYSEGFADYYGTARVLDKDTIEVGHPLENRYLSFQNNRWLPLSRIITARSYADLGGNLDLLYAQGWLLVHYLANSKERRGQLEKFLNLVNAGQPFEAAMDAAFGPGARELDAELRDYASRRRLMALSLPFKPIDVGTIAIRRLPAVEDDLLQYNLALDAGVLKRSAAKFADQVRKAAARYPGDPHALQLLTEAERAAGNDAAAAQAVERWLAVRPGDAMALMHKGALQIAALRAGGSGDFKAWDDARKLILAANKALPREPRILLAYYDSFTAQGRMPPAAAQNALVAAFEAIPQDGGIRHQLAYDYEQRGMIEDAIAVIKPAAFRLHNAETDPKKKKKQDENREKYRQVGDTSTETAREMLLRLEKKLAEGVKAGGR